ncbi:putative inositol-polyphosphate 5-phosphatase [Rosa chinensis]|uniref:Putative inositol-polyphosphate 5-phosphatase n=1 Tax=Rosa chinensis TaxID=74649 RepID=A0A2P6Q937_ROSCH|nr:putative inositol-polyphosphate 5-phosphatase [Rosa chinensis]
MIFIGSDPPSFGYQLRHRRGKSETTRAQYINTKDVRFVYVFLPLAMLGLEVAPVWFLMEFPGAHCFR